MINYFNLAIASFIMSTGVGTAIVIETGLDETISKIVSDLRKEDKTKLSASINRLSDSFNRLAEDENLRAGLTNMLELENASKEERREMIAQQIKTAFEGNGEKPKHSLDSIIDQSIDASREFEEVADIKSDLMIAMKQYL